MNAALYSNRSYKTHLTSILLLVIVLFSAVSHSHEYSADGHSLEQLDCKLCQQLADPPKQKIKLAKIILGSFSAENERLVSLYLKAGQYSLKSPRAPPLFT